MESGNNDIQKRKERLSDHYSLFHKDSPDLRLAKLKGQPVQDIERFSDFGKPISFLGHDFYSLNLNQGDPTIEVQSAGCFGTLFKCISTFNSLEQHLQQLNEELDYDTAFKIYVNVIRLTDEGEALSDAVLQLHKIAKEVILKDYLDQFEELDRGLYIPLKNAPEAIIPNIDLSSPKQTVQKFAFPLQNLSRKDRNNYERHLERMDKLIVKEYDAKIQYIDVNPLEKVKAIVFPAEGHEEIDPSTPMMILFHANAMTAEHMHKKAGIYQMMGFNVVTMTLRGYPGSDGSETTEKTALEDMHAIINHLKGQGYTRMGVHGTSIGGNLALQATKLHPDVVKACVLDQTFTSLREVTPNMAREQNVGKITTAGADVVAKLLTGFDNLKLIDQLNGKAEFITITAKDDPVMKNRQGNMNISLRGRYQEQHHKDTHDFLQEGKHLEQDMVDWKPTQRAELRFILGSAFFGEESD